MSRPLAFRAALVGLGLSVLLFACQIPVSPASKTKATLTLGFTPPTGRTVVPDLQPLLAAVYSIDLQIERTDVASTPYVVTVTGDGVAGTTKTLTDLEPGTYTIDATAYDNTLSSPIAYGKQLSLDISAGEVLSEAIVLAPSLSAGTGDLNLKAAFPATAGVTAVAATLTNRSGDTSHDFTLRDSLITQEGGWNSVTVTESGLPSGSYDLELRFTENGSTLTYQQAVNIFQGQITDHVVDGAGSLATEWSLTQEYFASSTFLADVSLSNNPGLAFSSPTRNYNLATQATSYQVTVSAAYSGQTFAYWDGVAGVWVDLSNNVPTAPFDMVAHPEYATLTIRVTSPGLARGYYTFNFVQAGGAGVTSVIDPEVSVLTPVLGQVSWAQNETVTASASSTTAGSWAWYFDAVPVPGQTESSFSMAASALSSVLGNHLLTVLFTDSHGFTWAANLPITFIDAADVVVSIKTKQTRINLSGSDPLIYNTAVGDFTEFLSINFDDVYLQKIWYGVDNFDSPTAMTYDNDYTTTFNISGVGLDPGFHTLMIQAQFFDGTLAGVLVPFEVRARDSGSAESPFVVTLAPRYFPTIYTQFTTNPWKARWFAEEVSAIDFSVKIPALGGDTSAVLRYSLAGKVSTVPVTTSGTVNISIPLSAYSPGLTPGAYPLTLDLWAGPSPGERRSVGSLTVLVQFLGGSDEI